MQKLKAKADADAAEVRRQADAYAKKAKADADAALSSLNERIAGATASEQKARDAEVVAKTAADKNTKAASLAEARAIELQAKIDRLLAAIRTVT